MRTRAVLLVLAAVWLALALAGCEQDESGQWIGTTIPDEPVKVAPSDVLVAYPISSYEGVIDEASVHLGDTSVDGNGSFMITVDAPATIRLYETGDIDIENALVTYRAKIKTGGLEGEAMLEMWCVFEELGEFFSRGLDSTVSGTTDGWVNATAVFRLEDGQNPDNIKLNVAITGPGTIWIDSIRVTKAPLP